MLNYVETASGATFHASEKHIKALMGPFGSGKSTAAAVEVLSRCCQQPVAADGTRYARVGVIRATYPKLLSTTRKSLIEVLPPEYGTITNSGAPLRGFYTIPLPDGTTVHMELELVALNGPDASMELRSFNWTFAWLNEANELTFEAFAAAEQRVGRYPSQDLGGVAYGGLIMDFNRPAQGSWLDTYIKAPPENMELVQQPAAAFKKEDEQGQVYYEVNPGAENLRNLGSPEAGDPDVTQLTGADLEAYLVMKGMRYYKNQIETQLKLGRDDVVQNLYCMLDVRLQDGKPVFPTFNRARHIAPQEIQPVMFHPVIIGVDTSGVHPAGAILQMQNGVWCVLDEMYADGEGLENFIYGLLVPRLRERYATCPVTAACDPANARDAWTATTPRDRFEEAGIAAVTEITNSPKIRIQTVEHMLNLTTGGLLVSPVCEDLIRGFEGEYKYRKLRTSGSVGEAFTPQPEKSTISHIMDALQYACLLIHKGNLQPNDGMQDVARRLQEKRQVLSRIMVS